jgi:hypothetical protein|tara:strand:- start:272 stop:499 length:228 start_codon:yes stop_codon:yes gene_type:complete
MRGNKELDLEIEEELKQPFYVIDEYARVFAGLRNGYPHFSEKPNDAKQIYNDAQFRNIKYGYNYKIERIELQDLL